MNNKVKHISIFGIFILSSCMNKSDLLGVYNSPNLKRNHDSLWLKKDGTYLRKLYFGDSLILIQNNTWSFKNGDININKYFTDLDDKYSLHFNFQNRIIDISTNVSMKNGHLQFHYGYLPDDKFYYRKIDEEN